MKNNPASLCGSGIIFIAKRNVPDVSGGGIPGTIVLDIRRSFSYLMVTIVAP